MFKGARPRGTDSARVIKVIETRAISGRGTDDDPVQVLVQYWDFDGNKLAEDEPRRQASLGGQL